MKPNKALLIIAVVYAAFAILLCVVYFYISTRLTPEQVRELTTQALRESFPKANVEVGEVSFNFSTSIEFLISKVRVANEIPLFSLENAKFKIPLWAILKGGGVVEL